MGTGLGSEEGMGVIAGQVPALRTGSICALTCTAFLLTYLTW